MTKPQANEQAKAAGLPDLHYVAKKVGKPVQTLRSWAKQYPELFKTVLDGCVVQYQAEQAKDSLVTIQRNTNSEDLFRLVGCGFFHTDSGFTEAEARRIAHLINNDPEFPRGNA